MKIIKPRVLIVSHSIGHGGAEKCLLGLAKGINRRHYDIIVSCPKASGLWQALGELGIGRTLLPVTPWILRRFRTPRSLIRLPVQTFNIFRALFLLRVGRFTIVHLNSFDSIEPAIAGRILGLRVVIHCRGILRDNPYNFIGGWRNACKLLYKVSDILICVSQAVHSQMVEAGCPAHKLKVVQDGIDLEDIYSPVVQGKFNSEDLPESSAIIGCVARINPQKGYSTLFHAFSLVRRHVQKAQLIVVGGGRPSYVRKIKQLCSDLGIMQSTQFVGEASNVASYYPKFQVLVVPSIAEGFGLTYVEAGLFGIPAIGTTSGGASEIIQDGITGLIVPPGNPELLADAMRRILENPKLGKEMGKRAKERVTRLFTGRRMVEGVESVYEELLRDKFI